MKKLLLGMVIGAALAGGIFYYLNIRDENEHQENVKALLELMKQKKVADELTSATINDPGNMLLPKQTLSIMIPGGNEYYYYRNADCSKLVKISYEKIRDLLREEKERVNPKDLMILIKEYPGASLKSSIDLLDAISYEKIPAGHFAAVDISEKEKDCLQHHK